MKTLLVTGGVALLVIGSFLLIAGIVAFFISRSRSAKGAAPPQRYPQQPVPQQPIPPRPIPPPQPQQVPQAAPPQRPAVPPPPPAPPASEPEATVVVTGVGGMGALHAVSGPLAGKSFPLKMDGYYIGRDVTQSQVVVDNPSVSKRHVWVGIRDGAVIAIDQASTNGTYLNTVGTRIGQVRLSPGDTLILSDDVARFVYKA